MNVLNKTNLVDPEAKPLDGICTKVIDSPDISPHEHDFLLQRVVGHMALGAQRFGFHVLRELGRGGFGRVYLARQVDLADRLVVLKFSPLEGAEPQTLAQLQHTHIVPIYSVHEDAEVGLRAVCMPYFGGGTLAQILDLMWQSSTLPVEGRSWSEALATAGWQEPAPGISPLTKNGSEIPLNWFRNQTFVAVAVWLAARLAEALRHAHQRGVIHRDIKPTNILIGADGQPLLLDFNVSRNARVDPADGSPGGTVAYAAPEHLQALDAKNPALFAQVDERSDIYSLGLVLFKCLTDTNPFEIDEILTDRSKLPSRTSPSARRLRPDIPWSLDSILRKCLAPDPAQRYREAAHFAEDLHRFLNDQPLRFAPETSWRERIHKWGKRHPRLLSGGLVAAVAGVLLLAAGVGVLGIRRHRMQAEEQLATAQARERQQQYENGALRALCLVNTVSDVKGHLPQGVKTCESTLALFGVLENEDWQRQPAWQRLTADDRRRLAENTRELLLLLAWARVQTHANDPAVLRQALDLVDRAEAIVDLPPSQALALNRANFLEALGDDAQAKQARQRAEQMLPSGAQDHYLLATLYARRGTVEAMHKAIAALNQALALNPRHYWALAQRGICREELGQHTLAVGDFSTCVGLWPYFAWGYFNRGYVLGKTGHRHEAIHDFGVALEHDHDFVAAYLNRGLLHLELKQYERALHDLDQAKRLGHDDASLHAGRGMALEGLRRFSDADDAFRAAFARADALAEPLRARIGWTYGFAVLTRLPERARAAFDKVLKTNPQEPHALYGLALLDVEKADLRKAIVHFDHAVAADPGFIDGRRGRALVHARLSQWTDASRDINWCLEKEPQAGVTLYAAACITALAAQKNGDPQLAEQALHLLEKAFAQNYGKAQAPDDVDLAGIRNHPAFQRLLQRVDKNSSTQ